MKGNFLETSSVFRVSREDITYRWITLKRCSADKNDNDIDNEESEADDDNVEWHRNNVSEILKVGDIAIIKADDPVHFFYLVCVTKTAHTLDKKVCDGHVYQTTHEVLVGNYMEIASEDTVSTKCFVESCVALIPSFSIIGLCPDFHETSIYVKQKLVSYYEIENFLSKGLKWLLNAFHFVSLRIFWVLFYKSPFGLFLLKIGSGQS